MLENETQLSVAELAQAQLELFALVWLGRTSEAIVDRVQLGSERMQVLQGRNDIRSENNSTNRTAASIHQRIVLLQPLVRPLVAFQPSLFFQITQLERDRHGLV